MKVLALDHFYKSVPKEKEQLANEKIVYLIKVLEQYNYHFESESVPKGLDLKRVKSSHSKIYKFRVDGGDRILCSKAKYLYPNIEREFSDSLVLLEYCNHDSQIRKARSRRFSNNKALETSDHEVSVVINDGDQRETVINYSLHASTTIVKNIRVDQEQLLDVFGDEGKFYYLSPKQKQIVNDAGKGQFVFGSAGSGKTTISVYKIIQFLLDTKDSPDARLAYFTYSDRLKEQTERLFEKIAKEIYGLNTRDFKEKVEFHTVEDFLEQNTNLDGKIVTYQMFKDWYDTLKQVSKFDPTGVWKERRGIFQGMIGPRWQQSIGIPSRSFHQEHLEYANRLGYIEFHPDDPSQFTLKVDVNLLCNTIEATFHDAEGLRDVIIEAYNHQIATKNELSLDEYYHLKDRDSLYYEDEREKIVTIFKRFDRHMKSLRSKGFYEEGELVRLALQKVTALYDYMIIDEVQDLTEIQIYYLYQLLRNKWSVFVCGDFHQTINPTFFHVGRIESIFRFLGGMGHFQRETLEENYRSSKNIVTLANQVSELRKQTVATNEELNYTEIAQKGETRRPYLYLGDKEMLWNYVQDKSYLYIVVATLQTKQQLLEQYPDLQSRIMTVSEIKGIENKYIIAYNIFSDYKEQWERIFSQLGSSTTLKSEIFRYYFNVAYVSITRARDILGLIEDDLPEKVESWLKEEVDVVSTFDIKLLSLQEQSTADDQLMDAMQQEKNGNFDQAKATFKLVLKNSVADLAHQAEKGIKRCELKKECQLTKDYNYCGEQLVALGDFEEAIPYLRRGKNAKVLLKAILLVSSSQDYDLNQEMEKLNTDPLSELLELNDEQLTSRFIKQEIDPFKHQYQKMVRKSDKMMMNLVKRRK